MQQVSETISLKQRVYELIRNRAERGATTPTAREMGYLFGCSPELAMRVVNILANEGVIERHKNGNNLWSYGIGPYWTVENKQADPCWQMGKVGATMEEGCLAMSEAIDRYILERRANENA